MQALGSALRTPRCARHLRLLTCGCGARNLPAASEASAAREPCAPNAAREAFCSRPPVENPVEALASNRAPRGSAKLKV